MAVATFTPAQTSLANNANTPAGQVGSPWTVAPPNPSLPVSGANVVNGSPLNLPPSAPADNGSSLVASATTTGLPIQQPQQSQGSQTPNIDSSSGLGGISNEAATGDYSQDPNVANAQNSLNQSENAEASAINNEPSQSQLFNNALNTTGANTDLTQLNQLNTQLAQETAAYNNASQQQQTNGVNTGTPAVFYQGAQAAIQRQQAVVVGGLAVQVQAAQGNYNSAEALAEKTANLAFSDAQNKIDNIGKFVTLNQQNLTEAEKVAMSKIDAQQKQQQIQLDQQKQALTYQLTYPQAGIQSTDNLATAAQKASAYLEQNPQFGSKLQASGTYYDDQGNTHTSFVIQYPNGSVVPYQPDSTQMNVNLGMSTGTKYGINIYNTSAQNPGVTRDVRNSNPMSITANANSVNMPGVIGVEPGQNGTPDMLIFATPQMGVQAGTQMLASSPIYANMTAGQAINQYITGDKNKAGGYSSSDLGLDPNKDFQTQLKDPTTLQNVTQKLMQHEDSHSAANLQNEQQAGTPSFQQYGLLGNTDFNPSVLTDSRAAQYLDSYIKTGSPPSARTLGVSSSSPLFGVIAQRANDLYYKATGQPLPNPAIIEQQQQLLKNNNQLANNLAIQEQTVSGNIDLSLNNMTKNGLNSSNFAPLNSFIDKVKLMFSDPATSQLIAQNATIQNELGSLLAVKNASGTTVYDKLNSAGIISSSDTKAQVQTKIQALLNEAKNFKGAIDSANSDIYKQIDPLMTNPNNPLRSKYQTALAAGYQPDEIQQFLNGQ